MDEDIGSLGYSPEELFRPITREKDRSERITAPRYSYWKSVGRIFFRKKSNWVVLLILTVVLLFTYLYPSVIGYDPKVDAAIHVLDSQGKHLGPKAAMERYGANIHWVFGSGAAGQSTFDAVWYGARISVTLALVCAAINLVIGVLVGLVWGFSKRMDAAMTQVYHVASNVPYILIISVIVRILTGSFWAMVFALTVTGWLSIAYFIRTQVLIIRDREYNLASRCLGTPLHRMALKNILPFMTSVIVTLAAAEIPSYISYEVFLTYIGIGLRDASSLGVLIKEAQNAMLTPGWELEFWAPVAVASVITVTLYVAGQNLADASDPRTHL